ncbi:MAG: ABC transporter substrate-binding protein [Spirochaetales bacterium]|nr:ABC transporter substrate-binding protein [Spirochaetales bacterium]
MKVILASRGRTTGTACAVLALAILLALPAGAQSAAPSRVVVAGRASIMVADVLYAFPSARTRVLAVAGADQGLGYFLGALDPAWAALPPLDRAASAETLAALKPDLVVLKAAMKASLGPALDAIGLRKLYLNLETPEDYAKDLAALGAAIGAEDRARELAAYYASRVADIGKKVSGRAKPRVLLVQASAGSGVWEAPPAAWMQTVMTKLAGGEPVWTAAALGSGWTRLGAEEIAAMNPEVVVVVGYRDDASALSAAFATDPRFAATKAVLAGRVLAMPQDFYSWDQPDTRWILGLAWLARALHPDAFAGAPLEVEVRSFFQTFYGIDRAKFDTLIAPRLKGDHGIDTPEGR